MYLPVLPVAGGVRGTPRHLGMLGGAAGSCFVVLLLVFALYKLPTSLWPQADPHFFPLQWK